LVRLAADFSSRYPLLAGHGTSVQWIMIHRQQCVTPKPDWLRLATRRCWQKSARKRLNLLAILITPQQEPTGAASPAAVAVAQCGSSGIAVVARRIFLRITWGSGRWSDILIDHRNCRMKSYLSDSRYFLTGGKLSEQLGFGKLTPQVGVAPVRGIAQIEEIQPRMPSDGDCGDRVTTGK